MTLDPLFLPLAALALPPLLASGSRRAVGWSLVGALLILLGASAASPDWDDLARAPLSFVAVSAGLAELGLFFFVISEGIGKRAGESIWLDRFGRSATAAREFIFLMVTIWVLDTMWPLFVAGGWHGPLVAAGLFATGVVGTFVLSRLRITAAVRWLDDHLLARRHTPDPKAGAHGRHTAWYVILGAVLAVLLSHRLIPAVLEALAVLAGAYLVARRTGRAPKFPVQGVVAGVSLLAFVWCVRTIAGPDIALRFPAILDTPFSDAAEAALALVLGLAVWVMLGLWPWHGAGPGSVAALVGGAFLIRWGVGLIPDGITHAAPIFGLVAGVAALHAAATGRLGEYLAALGVLAVVGGGAGAWGLFGLASVLATLRLIDYTIPIPGLDRRELGGVVLIPLLAWSLPMMLTGETFMTVVSIFAGVALFRPATN